MLFLAVICCKLRVNHWKSLTMPLVSSVTWPLMALIIGQTTLCHVNKQCKDWYVTLIKMDLFKLYVSTDFNAANTKPFIHFILFLLQVETIGKWDINTSRQMSYR